MIRSFASCVRAAALLLVLVFGGGCGGGHDDSSDDQLATVVSAVEGLSGKARIDRLRELAEEEGGTLNLYTSMTPGDEDAVSSAFEDAFGIDVSVYRASAETVAQRLAQEHEAGFHGADVLDTNGVQMTLLSRRDILSPYRPRARGLASGSFHPTWTESRFNTFVVSWNTDRVSAEERPRNWADLAQPRWRGKLGLEAGDFDWYQALGAHWRRAGKSQAQIDRLFGSIARNAVVVKGHSLLAELLAAGELDVVATNYRHVVQRFIDDEAPVAWIPAVEPVITRAEGVGLIQGAEHPAAALLFLEWMLGDGQKLIVELGRDPARSDLAEARRLDHVAIDVTRLADNQRELSDRFERLVRLGKTGPSD